MSKVLDLLDEIEKGEEPQKFTAVVSNPPYQMETAVKEGQEQPTVTNVFQHFQEVAYFISEKCSMIYPAARWIQQSGKGMKDFGRWAINNPHLHSILVLPGEGKEGVFHPARIPGGVSIVFWDTNKSNEKLVFSGVSISRPSEEILPMTVSSFSILEKIKEKQMNSLFHKVSARSLFSIESSFAEMYPELVFDGKKPAPSFLKDPIRLFTNDKAGKGGKPIWFWTERSNVKTNVDKIDRWQVVTQSAIFEGCAFIFSIIPTNAAHGRVRVSVSDFDSEEKANNFLEYMMTKFSRYLLNLSASGGLSSLASFVPDLEDYTDSNPHIDWSQPLDPQLYELFKLTEDEIKVVEGGK